MIRFYTEAYFGMFKAELHGVNFEPERGALVERLPSLKGLKHNLFLS